MNDQRICVADALSDVRDRRAVLRAYTFETIRGGQLRTAGIGLWVPTDIRLSEWNTNDAVTLARAFDPLLFSAAPSARGKVFFVGPADTGSNFSCVCYQVRGVGAAQVACGNASAAAAVVAGFLTGAQIPASIDLNFIAENTTFFVSCKLELFEVGETLVTQSWSSDTKPAVSEIVTLNSRSVRATVFNDYLILQEPSPIRPESAVQFLTTTGRLQDKLAIIDSRLDGPPQVTFYNCNGRHGAAPLTGLATLAIAAQEIEWLHKSLYTAGGEIRCPSGREDLPIVAPHGHALSFSLPATGVRIGRL